MKNGFRSFLSALLVMCLCTAGLPLCYGQAEMSPLEYLKEQELKYRDAGGEVYLGKVMTLHYTPYRVDPDEKYGPLLLELTDVLKTPLRKDYRMVLKGYSDASGPSPINLNLSRKRAEALRRHLTETYFMDFERITEEAFGDADPLASNDTPEGRQLNRRVEIHIYGDVAEAVRFIEREEEAK